MLTIPQSNWTPGGLPDGVVYLKGQLEQGAEGGYMHWQVLCLLSSKGTLRTIREVFGTNELHAELTRSRAANDYVWKDDTAVEGTRFIFSVC